jgi:small subunit ribosomal protein S18
MKNRQCYFQANNIKHIDYKDVKILSKFINPNGRIMSAKRTGTSSKMQRQLAAAIKNARYMGLMPYIAR